MKRLPRELRDKIYLDVWDSAQPKPPTSTFWHTPALTPSMVTKENSLWVDNCIVDPEFAYEIVHSLYTTAQHDVVHPTVNTHRVFIPGPRSTLKVYLATDAFGVGLAPKDVPLKSLRLTFPLADEDNCVDMVRDFNALLAMNVRKDFSLRIICPRERNNDGDFFYRVVRGEGDVVHISGQSFFVDGCEIRLCYKAGGDDIKKLKQMFRKRDHVVYEL